MPTIMMRSEETWLFRRGKHMTSHALAHTDVRLRNQNRPTRCLRIRPQGGEWRLSEEGDRVGGFFRSLSSAVTYARDELRGERGGRVVLELDGSAYDGQP